MEESKGQLLPKHLDSYQPRNRKMETVSEIIAVWDVSLTCECPGCKNRVDLLEYCDFWDGRKLKVIEHDTEMANDLEVICPECGHDFNVCCTY